MYSVLVVDDDYLVREGFENAVDWSMLGYRLIGVAGDGKEALELFLEHRPEVVVTDIKMPLMDGIELCMQLRTISSDVKIIILSGYNEFSYAQKAVEYDVYSYMLKPLDMNAFKKNLESIRREIDNMRDIQNMEQSWNVVQDMLVEIWIHRIISDKYANIDQCRKQLIRAGFRDCDKYFSVMALCLENAENDVDVRISDYFSSMTRMCKERHALHVYENQISYVILVSENQTVLKKAKTFYTALLDELRKQKKHEILLSCAVGGMCRGLDDLRRISETARDLLMMKYYHGLGRLMDNGALLSRSTKPVEWPKQQYDILTQNICDGNEADIRTQLQEIYTGYKEKGTLDQNLLCVEMIRIYTRITNDVLTHNAYVTPISHEKLMAKIHGSRQFHDAWNELTAAVIDMQEQIRARKNSNNKSFLIENIKKYIKDNFKEDLSLECLAEKFFIHSTYLSRLFKENTHTNIRDYIKEVRIAKAQNYLLSTKMSIREISVELGYNDYRHFCTVFKRYNNMSPLQFRITKGGSGQG